MGIRLNGEHLEDAVLGGAVLGGGGGGAIPEGLRLGREALSAGVPRLVSLDSLQDDAEIATASLVGSPASLEATVEPADHLRAWQILSELASRRLDGVISSENGAVGTVNGWLQSSALGIPLVNAPANGRAHPTGQMGSLGLEHAPNHISKQAVAGGNRGHGIYLELQVSASLETASRIVRNAAELAGGLVAVARNPVSVAYLRANAAVGALSQALGLGKRLRAEVRHGADWVIHALTEELGASLIVKGPIEEFELRQRCGYDTGLARVAGTELIIWNEYITLDVAGDRRATFPDLIVTIDLDTALPLTSGDLAIGRRIAVMTAPSGRLLFGAGLKTPKNYLPLEAAVEREIIRFVFPAEELVH